MIKIKKNTECDSRTCDFTKVTKDQLLVASLSHIDDVRRAINFLIEKLNTAGQIHDITKVSEIDAFHKCFLTGFSDISWWEMHQREERHHFNNPKFIRTDINLIDVLEQIVDGVVAGMARSGSYRFEPLSDELLQRAYINTANLLLSKIEVYE